ncbi:hypothetical protein AB0L75_23065 [Streptomyces sp. NPDC052101]|uniref:hypothetical protein n=1 Tax=Streptomyces sp. NPDC052101 TaxID=3155763 RepID=UPI003416A9CB
MAMHYGAAPTVPTAPTSTARGVGAVICGVLAALELAWMTKDFGDAGLHDTVWTWSGGILPGQHHGLLATNHLDVVLLVAYVVACCTARKPAGPGALVMAALLTLAFRTPTVWIFSTDWADGAPAHTRLLLTGITGVLGAIALLVIASAGRRPTGNPAAPPRLGLAVTAGILLAGYALVTVAWQLYYMHEYTADRYGPASYWNLFIGKGPLNSLLAPPPFWTGCAIAVLCLVAAVMAFIRTPLARALGMALGATLIVIGAVTLTLLATAHVPFTFHDLPTRMILEHVTMVVEIAVGLVVLALLAPGDRRPAMTGLPGLQPPAQAYGGWRPPAP